MSTVLLMIANEELRELVSEYMKLESWEVKEAKLSRSSLGALSSQRPDLVVIGDGLSAGSGLAFARDVREASEAPIIMVSDRNTESDRITALELGVDDVLGKPVSPKELILRAKKLLFRRDSRSGVCRTWMLDQTVMRLDLDSHRVEVAGQPVALTPAEWKVLSCLARQPGAVMSRARIMEEGFRYSAGVYDRIVDTHVKNLRVKLGGAAWIDTVRGFGYRFAGRAVDSGVEGSPA